MATQEIAQSGRESPGVSFLYDPKIRGLIYQAVVFIGIIALIYWIANNTVTNLQRAHIASGWGFLKGRAGFDISQSLIPYTNDATYARALLVGVLNTLYVAVFGIILATVVGFLVGVGRLSRNWLIAKICLVYVEVFRNIPTLLVIFFWYFGVLMVMPVVRQSYSLPLGTYINNRGLFYPSAVWGDKAWLVGVAFLLALVLSFFVARWARARQMATGQIFPVYRTAAALIVGLPLLAFVVTGFPLTFNYPKLGNFNLSGGSHMNPEFLALLLALSFYTASFIAEVVRAGILGVSKGQTEAAYALGLRPGQTMRQVVVPQALRIIIPPLTNQYLNLLKNSSLAIAIAYPDLVAVGGTILNQTGQAVEVVAIWMVIYLGLSLATSGFMNWFNGKMALVER
ncbi:amino acid ABC transporter permease [Brucella endophytica]|uniref:Amino acid ABC transporter permease n=1 Tax=Brucella endophytica TaxID=1963359 RepID=A0A916WFC5_9HYPH|nr:amino acid ABC transporter permease [Brucella endophytica]GGA92377.1 amino acid ABC transporter permease [Brucella endophytica]